MIACIADPWLFAVIPSLTPLLLGKEQFAHPAIVQPNSACLIKGAAQADGFHEILCSSCYFSCAPWIPWDTDSHGQHAASPTNPLCSNILLTLILNSPPAVLSVAVGFAEVPYSWLGHTGFPSWLLSFKGGEHHSGLWGMRKDPSFFSHAISFRFWFHTCSSWSGFICHDPMMRSFMACGCQRCWWGCHLSPRALLSGMSTWQMACSCLALVPAFNSPSRYIFNKENQMEQQCCFHQSSCSVRFFISGPCTLCSVWTYMQEDAPATEQTEQVQEHNLQPVYISHGVNST